MFHINNNKPPCGNNSMYKLFQSFIAQIQIKDYKFDINKIYFKILYGFLLINFHFDYPNLYIS